MKFSLSVFTSSLALLFLSSTTAAAAVATSSAVLPAASIDALLKPLLSSGASIVHTTSAIPRWSNFSAPAPGTVVNVATEADVAATVNFSNCNNIPYLAQNGGNGWSTTFTLGSNGIIINLRGLNTVTFNDAKTEATIGGGVSVAEAIDAAYAAGVAVQTGNCNCVGALGAYLGGGYGHLMGLYGMGVDNLISVNLVQADGTLVTVTPESNPDLWWALRGAGPNFGIVTSAVIKSYPTAVSELTAWTGVMLFTDDKIEGLVQLVNDLPLGPDMGLFMYYINTGAPTVAALPWYYSSNETEAKAVFAPLYALEPYFDGTAMTPYNEWNAGGDVFCARGPYKPSYGAGLTTMVPETWRSVWDLYVEYSANNGTSSAVVLLEGYPLEKAQSIPASTAAFPHRSTIKFNAVVMAAYEDTALQSVAQKFGSDVRELLYSTGSTDIRPSYVNFAYGDDSLTSLYGTNVEKLKTLKAQYDPSGKFSQWFPLE